ncbi:LON peptidase substrate-binding domain-containing protein, partial [Planctomycetota bacterium]
MTIDDFNGIARLFPLPNLVMFPQVVQPLRIFEPRYLEMLQEAIATDRMLAMATLMPGWEPGQDAIPPVHQSICMGHIMSEAEAEDGSYNIFLAGVARGTIIEECESNTAFRRAEVEILPDVYGSDTDSMTKLQDELVTRFRNLMPASKVTDDLL